MTSIGETLRRERQRRNLDLEQISRELKISPRMLEAIEQEKFEKLPGGVFAKSFVRQYARLLGLDEDEIAGEMQRTLAPPEPAPQFQTSGRMEAPPIQVPRVQKWETLGESRFSWSSPLSALAMVVVVMLACSAVYAWWQRTRHTAVQAQNSATEAVIPAPQQIPQPVAPPVAQEPAAQQAPAQESPKVESPPVSAPAKAPAEAAAPPSNPNAPVRVQVTADEPVWILARGDGKYIFSGTLEANQTRTVEANTSVQLRLGNAGGVTILLNGKPVGSIGPKGQVRTVQLTAGGFEVLTAPKIPE